MTKARLLLIGILCVVALLAGGFAAKLKQPKAQKRFVPYTIVWQVTERDAASGKARIIYTETRFKFSDGRWRNIKFYPDGSTEETFSEPGRGVFKVSSAKLHFISESPREPRRTKFEDYLSSPQYAGTEVIQGIVTAKLHTQIGDMYVAPTLDNDWIKAVFFPGSNESVNEPIAIMMGEPDPGKFEHPEFPVSFENFKAMRGEDAVKEVMSK